MALGALQAIEAAGRTVNKDIYLVGVDALVEVVENVMNDKMTGTVFNDYFGQAHTAVSYTHLDVYKRQCHGRSRK